MRRGSRLKLSSKVILPCTRPDGILQLKRVLYVPGLSRNLCSTAPLVEDGYAIAIGKGRSTITLDQRPIANVVYHENLPFIDGYTTTTPSAFLAARAAATAANLATATSIN